MPFEIIGEIGEIETIPQKLKMSVLQAS